MLGEGKDHPSNVRGDSIGGLITPENLRRRLLALIDIDLVGADGLWTWLSTVLSILEGEPGSGKSRALTDQLAEVRVHELAGDLVRCAGDRARLTVMCEHYFTDNQLLARRVKALEAILSTAARAGGAKSTFSADPVVDKAAVRYSLGGESGHDAVR